MDKIKIGVIGCGNMGRAILMGSSLSVSLKERFEFFATSRSPAGLKLPENVSILLNNNELAALCDYIILAVKPNQILGVVSNIIKVAKKGSIIISVAAGISLNAIKSGNDFPCVRVMPNTPTGIGKGLFGICFDDHLLAESDKAEITNFFAGMGKVLLLSEDSFDAFSALAGCGPAYVYYIMDAMIEAAVTLGFKRSEGASLVQGLFDGSVSLAGVSNAEGISVANLREQVCSPAGMTIAGTNYLDQNAVRGHIVQCILRAYEKGKNMGKA